MLNQKFPTTKRIDIKMELEKIVSKRRPYFILTNVILSLSWNYDFIFFDRFII